MMIRALTLAAGLAAASTANAAFLGVDLVVDQDATAAARALSDPTGDPAGLLADATVYQLVAAFDNGNNRVNSIFSVNFQIGTGGSLFQSAFGTDSGFASDAILAIAPSAGFDSLAIFNGNTANLDPNGFITRQSQGLSGAGLTGDSGWFTNPDNGFGRAIQGNEAVAGLSSNIDLSSAWTVWLGQFTVIGQGTRADITGELGIGFNENTDSAGLGGDSSQGRPSELLGLSSDFGFVPTPGALSLFGLAGLTAARRRRSA